MGVKLPDYEIKAVYAGPLAMNDRQEKIELNMVYAAPGGQNGVRVDNSFLEYPNNHMSMNSDSFCAEYLEKKEDSDK